MDGALRHLSNIALSRALRLPTPTTRYTVHREHIPMRDGVRLLADHYVPAGEPAGTLLVRCPYGRGFPFALAYGRIFAGRGYRVILQSVRGTFGSGGVFEPMVNEADDGADTVAWLRTQPWFTGTFGTIGLSYLGFTQWALLADPPPELAAAVIAVGPHDLHQSTWGTGAFAVNDFLGWSYLMAHQHDRPRLRAGVHQLTGRRTVPRAALGLPLGASARALLGSGSPWFESWLEHPKPDAFWTGRRHLEALERARIPVLLLSGWQDLFVQQSLTQYRRLRDRGVDVRLTIGPWTHTEMLTTGLRDVTAESLRWLDTHLRGDAGAAPDAPVRIFRAGQGWCELPDWPPSSTPEILRLQPGGALGGPGENSACAPGASATFVFDPADPTPTIGGRLLSPAGGYRDDGRLHGRADTLSFTSAALNRDLTVCGVPVLELDHGSDNPDVDLSVRISEVDGRGRSRNVSDGYLRLREHSGPLRIELDPIDRVFPTGSRIRLLIGGGSHPRYARNLGTGDAQSSGSRLAPATHTVRLDESRLILPVVR